ncbi:ABC transporter ATP-binding protein [Filimonas effusa]|uniref:ATP-binding cassette domain-containing protein n=1 Tax=Filimonas effusa TaxID=2508721 RepID=A0A4V1M9P0_9BACT|nr:ATP-binding cassette domain-containing protein [Filimonas effusa]RXK81880.1 ATP-binding cassette domain-containing protein [Filimonas effusa]
MNIQLTDAGKRFNRDWIFRHINFTFEAGQRYAITGPNGSGKSTLLQVLAASMEPSEGKCRWFNDMPAISGSNTTISGAAANTPGNITATGPAETKPVEADHVFRYLTYAAPYLDIIEEMSALEFLRFHSSFKPFQDGITPEKIITLLSLEKAAHKQIRYYSSGMKQRLKLGQAIFAGSPLLLLDEPCTNLDAAGYALYHQLITTYTAGKTIVVSSNDPQEYSFCQHHLSILDYK